MAECVIATRLLLALVGGAAQPYLDGTSARSAAWSRGTGLMHDESALLATRSEFPTLAKGVHLISHSLGAVPKKARAYANQFLDEWENDSINAWHEWLLWRCVDWAI